MLNFISAGFAVLAALMFAMYLIDLYPMLKFLAIPFLIFFFAAIAMRPKSGPHDRWFR